MKFLLSIYTICWSFLLLGQNDYKVIHLTKSDGLPSNTIFQIKQDKHGFIWVSSPKGVAKFDGKKFTPYTIQHGLLDNTILSLFPDDSGGVLFSPLINKFTYYRYGKITPVLKEIKNVKSNWVSRYQQDKILLSSPHDSSIAIYKNFELIKKIALPHPLISLYEYNSFDNSNDVFLLNKSIPIIPFELDNYGRAPFPYYDLYILQNGKLKPQANNYPKKNFISIFYQGTLKLFEFKNHFITLHPLSKRKDIQCNLIFHLSDSITGISTNKGIFLLHAYTGEIIQEMLPNEFCYYLLLDRENNYWVSTANNGIFYIKNTNSHTIPHSYTANVTNLIHHRGELIYSIADSIFSYRDQKQKFIYRFSNNSIVKNIISLNDSQLIVNNGNLHLFQYKNGNWRKIFVTNNDLYKDLSYSNNTLLGSKINGVKRLDFIFESKNTKLIDTIHFFKDKRTTCAIQDYSNNIWIGSPAGLYKGKGDVYKKIEFLGNDKILHVATNRDSIIFINAELHGLYYYYKQTFYSINLPTKNIVINNISCSDRDTLIVSTSNGAYLILIHKNKYTLKHYSTVDGLASIEVNYAQISNEKIFCATEKGLSLIDLNRKTNINAPKLFIESIYNNQDTFYHPENCFEFNHDANTFSINISTISLMSEGHIHYRYKLEGYDREWLSGDLQEIRYTQVPPGNYQFRIIAYDYWGISSNPYELKLSILPPLWKTWWFLTIAALIILIGIYFIFTLRIRKIQRESREKANFNAQIAQLELEAIRGQMNPHFIFNALTSIQNFLINHNIDLSEKYLVKFARLIRKVVDQSKSNFISIQEEIEFLTTYLSLEKARFGDDFNFHIDIDKNLDIHQEIPTLIILNHIENCSKHAFDDSIIYKKIHLSFYLVQQNILEIKIEDNGLGFIYTNQVKKEINHRSEGQNFNRNRINIYNKLFNLNIREEISDKSTLENGNTGTIVTITIPMDSLNS
ncbi:MAG: histidine kinase [Chitinophagales bacterium]|nr:histidine kinase [Chitinophagales bacterium]